MITLVTALAALWLGFYAREVLDTIKKVVARLEALNRSKAPETQRKSNLIEPATRVEFLADMERERVEALNK